MSELVTDITNTIVQRLLLEAQAAIPHGEDLTCFCCGQGVRQQANAFVCKLPETQEDLQVFKESFPQQFVWRAIPGMAIILGGYRTCDHSQLVRERFPDLEIVRYLTVMHKMQDVLVVLAPAILRRTNEHIYDGSRCFICQCKLADFEFKLSLQSWVAHALKINPKTGKMRFSPSGNLVVDRFLARAIVSQAEFCEICAASMRQLFPFKKHPLQTWRV